MADIEKLDLSMAGERCDDAVLPCPFCGSKNIAYGKYEHTAGRRYAIVCMNCMAQIDPGWAQSWGAVQKAWNRRAQPANEPLTLEELREMYDEPVWVVCGIYKDWRIPEFIDEGGYKGFIKFTDRSAEPISDYGKNWVAYSRKLGGEQT